MEGRNPRVSWVREPLSLFPKPVLQGTKGMYYPKSSDRNPQTPSGILGWVLEQRKDIRGKEGAMPSLPFS